MKKTYKQPRSLAIEVDVNSIIAVSSLTGETEGLGYGGASPSTGGDVGGDAKSRVDFSEEIDLLW